MQKIIDRHYENLGTDYDDFVYYSPESVRKMSRKIIEKLHLIPSDVFADIGCGTGIFSLDILEQMSFEQPIIGVDPYPGMLAQIPTGANITPVAQDALSFSRTGAGYNKVLIKETLHHVDRKEELLANIHGKLPKGGMLLLVHLASDTFEHPTFDAALQRTREGWLGTPDEFTRLLENAGFQVERDAVECQRAVPKGHYLRMTQTRYMSVLTSFSGQELEAGLAELAARYADTQILKYLDHYDYLVAAK